MGIRSIAKRAQYGTHLIQLQSEGTNAIGRLQGLTASLPALKRDIEADADLTPEEQQDALAEVNEVITSLVSQVKEFANGL